MKYHKRIVLIGITVFILGIPITYFDTDWYAEDFLRISTIGPIFFIAGGVLIGLGFKSYNWAKELGPG